MCSYEQKLLAFLLILSLVLGGTYFYLHSKHKADPNIVKTVSVDSK